MGAVDFVGKPTVDFQRGMQERSEEIIQKVKAAARARVVSKSEKVHTKTSSVSTGPGYNSTHKMVAIGASTGGVEALREVICALPPDSPAILITQHMPGGFTKSFADRLNTMSAVAVSEATDGETVLPGHVYIAQGDAHLKLVRSGGRFLCKVEDGPAVSGHKPSVDVLFDSVATAAGNNAIGVILTGMGRDGAKGMKTMSEAGAVTLGQDETTSLVYGMPRVAHELGGVQHQLPLDKIAGEIIKHCSEMS